MPFPITAVINTLLLPVIKNDNLRGKQLRIDSIRVKCKTLVAYKVWLFLVNSEMPLTLIPISYDDLEAGDYFIDDTVYHLPAGYSIHAQTDVPGNVFIIINAEEVEA
jgi:hypothetical protein